MKDMKLWASSFWDNYKDEKEAIEEFGDLIVDHKGYSSEEQIGFDDILEEFYEMNEIHRDEIEDALNYHHKINRPTSGGAFLILADLGLWDGHHKGGKIVENFNQIFSECAEGMDDVIWEIKNDDLVITGTHHDGTNTFTVKFITVKGWEWALYHYGSFAYRNQSCHEDLVRKKLVRKMFSKDWKFEW